MQINILVMYVAFVNFITKASELLQKKDENETILQTYYFSSLLSEENLQESEAQS